MIHIYPILINRKDKGKIVVFQRSWFINITLLFLSYLKESRKIKNTISHFYIDTYILTYLNVIRIE